MNNEIREDASLRGRIEGIERELQMNELIPPGFPGMNIRPARRLAATGTRTSRPGRGAPPPL